MVSHILQSLNCTEATRFDNSTEGKGGHIPDTGAAIVGLVLGDALACKAFAALSVTHTVHYIGGVCAGVAELVQKLVLRLNILHRKVRQQFELCSLKLPPWQGQPHACCS